MDIKRTPYTQKGAHGGGGDGEVVGVLSSQKRSIVDGGMLSSRSRDGP